jgi:plasmid stabilization system protein ParE
MKVEFSARFQRALEAMAAHYGELRGFHPDAGAALDRFLEELEGEAIPLLVRQPGIGTRLPLHGDGFEDGEQLAIRIARAGRRSRVVARQWRVRQFWLLYIERDSRLVLLSVRHERQRDYP